MSSPADQIQEKAQDLVQQVEQLLVSHTTSLLSEEINALPEYARKYIMWLETEADPAGTIRENFRLNEENAALRVLIQTYHEERPDPPAGSSDIDLVRDFVKFAREARPVGQWPGERVIRAVEVALKALIDEERLVHFFRTEGFPGLGQKGDDEGWSPITTALYGLEGYLSQGYVVMGAGLQPQKYRKWGQSGPEWTFNREEALRFARREDAETFAKDDEDAFYIKPYAQPTRIKP